MTSDRVRSLSAEEEETAALDYYDDEDELEAFSHGELGCEDGGRPIIFVLGKVTSRRQRARGRGVLSVRLSPFARSNREFKTTHTVSSLYLWKTHYVSRERH